MEAQKSSLNILTCLAIAVMFTACTVERDAQPVDRSIQPDVNENTPEYAHPDREEPIVPTSTPDPAVSETG